MWFLGMRTQEVPAEIKTHAEALRRCFACVWLAQSSQRASGEITTKLSVY